ncbi:MAG: hypothetical protein ACRDL5_13085, partial [Solirubrobacteraceae bacterium]
AVQRLTDTNPQTTASALVAAMHPGQRLLFIRPLTEGAQNWEAPWTELVRLRSAQWGAVLQADVARGILKQVTWGPQQYGSSCCVANSAVLYRRTA